MSPRDNQKQRLYDAESGSGPKSKVAEKLLTNGKRVESTGSVSIEACQSYVDYVTTAAWFQSRWGRRHFTVRHKVYGRATASTWSGHISLPPWSREETAILHEIAHHLTSDRYADHGPEFAGVLLTLVRYMKGAEAAKMLRASFRRHRVKVSMATVPKPGSHKVTPRGEQKKRVNEVATRQKKREEEQEVARLRTIASKRFAAQVIRQQIEDGVFGEPRSKARNAALATARELERRSGMRTAARR